jgi:O-antigen/teichoic acid export membrane protein
MSAEATSIAAKIAEESESVEGPAKPGLRSRALRASVWRTSAYVADRGVSVLANILLARHLTNEAFGLVILAGVIYQGLSMFSEIGIGPAIVNHKKDDDAEFLNTAWTLQAMRGVGLWIIAAALAWPAAILYDQPMLKWLLPAVAINAAIAGFNSTSVFTLNRSLMEGRRSTLELCQGLVQRGTMIGLSFVWPSPWVIVIGLCCGMLFSVIGSHTFLPGMRNRFRWHTPSATELFAFGKWISVGTIIAFFGQQVDRLMLPKLMNIETLGVYGIALTVARLPQEFAGVLTQHVMFPLMAELARGDIERLREKLLYVRSIMLTVGVGATLGVIVASPWFFKLLYKPEYQDAAWMAPLAAGTTWLLLLESTASRALLGIGASRSLAIQSAVQVVVTAIACWIGYRVNGGAAGFIVGTTVGALAGHLVLLFELARFKLAVHHQDVLYTLLLGVLAIVGVGGPLLAERWWGPQNGRVAGLVLCVVLMAAVGAWVLRRVVAVLRAKP